MNKIAFFSTSSRPIKSLEKLYKDFEIVLIVTKEDKIIGKNKSTTPNDVKKFAISNNIKHIELSKFTLEAKEEVKRQIEELKPEIILSFDFGFIIPKDLLKISKYGIVNTHFSLLPKHRGASAVQFAILSDEKEYGITYHLVDATLDTGDIIYQSRYPLPEDFNSEDAYQFLFNTASNELPKVIRDFIDNKLTTTPQNHSEASYTFSKFNPKHTFIFKEDAIFDNKKSERQLFREIKAYNPWPLLEASISDLLTLKQFQGYKIKRDKNLVKIKINDAKYQNNQLNITNVTVIGGKKLNIKEFLNGYFFI
jgi:methionyl-tRNA formyltransferase